MTAPSVAQNRGLGGIGGPEELLRQLTLDGVVVLASSAPSGLADTVKDNDAKFPPDFRLSKSGRAKKG